MVILLFYLRLVLLEDLASWRISRRTFFFVSFLVICFLLGYYAMMYILYFISKYVCSHEKKSDAPLRDYLSTLILLWIFPIGIWVL